MKKALAAVAATFALTAFAAPAQAWHGHPVRPVTAGSHPRHAHSGANATLEEWQSVELGWTKDHVQNVFDNDGLLIANFWDGDRHLHIKQYPVDDTHVIRIVYAESGIYWLVDVKEWCTALPTDPPQLSCLT